jgi:protein O-GlcNAc transferase
VTVEEAEASYHDAVVLHEAAEWEKALALYDCALSIRPDFAKAHCARAQVLWNLKRQDEALAAVTSAISVAPRFAEAYFNRGNMLCQQRRVADALEDYTIALAIQPNFLSALNNRAGLLKSLKRYSEALKDLDRLVTLVPESASAHYNRGAVLLQQDRFDQAWNSLSRALALSPDHSDAFGALATAAIGGCSFERIDEIKPRLLEQISTGRIVVPPVIFLGQDEDPALQRRCAETNLQAWLEDSPQTAPESLDPTFYRNHPLRVAYMSSDFCNHPVGRQIVGVIERHDRNQFEVIGLGLGGDDGSSLRQRISAGCDKFYDLSKKSDAEAAAFLRALQIHILVDLNSQTEGWRPAILKRRAAPVQASFLGYAGTTGASFIDYVIADKQTVPADMDPSYSEKIVRLPDSFWPSDTKRAFVESSRGSSELPEKGLVFCAFNNHHKINRSIFECWMRLLCGLPGSILWLRSAPDAVVKNLRQYAAAKHVHPLRIVFAPIVSDEVHLGRHRLADLFLDTAPYNAHSSASDALWMGLPVLTLQGRCFAGRVASSMLHALNLPELVTESIDDYETMALALGRDEGRLAALKIKLVSNLTSAPLFDGQRFCDNLERAYRVMWSLARTNAPPRSFSI